VAWIDPAPAIARRVVDLLGPVDNGGRELPPELIFTSGRSHALTDALAPFFGGRVPA
jgi:glutamate racemase